jgi:hypothetical protein
MKKVPRCRPSPYRARPPAPSQTLTHNTTAFAVLVRICPVCHRDRVDVFGFVVIGTGAALWNTIAIALLAGGIFRALAGHRMRNGGPPPWFMAPISPDVSSDENDRTGRVGIISGGGKACTGAVMLGVMVWAASRDWHLWGQTLSILGKSSAQYLEVVGTFVACTAAGSIYAFFRTEREHHLPAKRDTGPRTRNRDPRRAQSRATGTVLIVGGAVLCVVCFAAAVYLTINDLFLSRPPYVEIVPGVVLLSGAVYAAGQNLIRRGRRHFVTVLPGIADLDDVVLYLRWFKEDAFLDRAYPRVGSPVLSHLLISGASEEEQLVKVLKPHGRVIAVGDPTEALPRIGAERFYLPMQGWREPVRELMARARLVVLSLGMGEGTLWELVEAMSTVPPERLILLVPMDEQEYETFRREAHHRLRGRGRLPEYRSDARGSRRNLSQGHRAAFQRDQDAGNRRALSQLDRDILSMDRDDPVRRVLEKTRDAVRRTRDDSLMSSLGEGVSVGTAMSFTSQNESVFQAVVHFPSWDAPVFTRLDTAMLEARRPTLFRDPRYVALENCLGPILRRGSS